MTHKIDRSLRPVRRVAWAGGWGRPLSAVLGLALLGLMGLLFWPDWRLAARWAGGTVIASGILGVIVWVVFSSWAKGHVEGILFGEGSAVPESYRALASDVLDSLGWGVWIPCLLVVVLGAGGVASSMWRVVLRLGCRAGRDEMLWAVERHQRDRSFAVAVRVRVGRAGVDEGFVTRS